MLTEMIIHTRLFLLDFDWLAAKDVFVCSLFFVMQIFVRNCNHVPRYLNNLLNKVLSSIARTFFREAEGRGKILTLISCCMFSFSVKDHLLFFRISIRNLKE